MTEHAFIAHTDISDMRVRYGTDFPLILLHGRKSLTDDMATLDAAMRGCASGWLSD